MKFFIWLLVIAVVALVLYAVFTGLPYDVDHPFTPPPHP